MPEPAARILRFSFTARLWHFVLILFFMVLSVTGLAWMYIETDWGRGLAALFGGYENTLFVHEWAGIIMLHLFFVHVLHMLARVNWSRFPKSLYAPNSLVVGIGDVREMIQHIGWMFGLAKKPQFDRYGWWEKFDYWAVWWGFLIVGITGLMLYDPVLTSDYMPGWLLNVALWVHRIEAVLAMGHVFTIHFFVEHFRPQTFPYSATMFDGTITLEKARVEYPGWVDRLEKEGRLHELMVPDPPVPLRILYFGFGYAMILLGLFLLVFALANAALLTL